MSQCDHSCEMHHHKVHLFSTICKKEKDRTQEDVLKLLFIELILYILYTMMHYCQNGLVILQWGHLLYDTAM